MPLFLTHREAKLKMSWSNSRLDLKHHFDSELRSRRRASADGGPSPCLGRCRCAAAELAAARFSVFEQVKSALEGAMPNGTACTAEKTSSGTIARDFETLKDDDELRRLLS
jgi:hypothetical protein